MDAIKKRIFWLLDQVCANCEKVKGKMDHYPICQGCPTYLELNQLGTHLDGGEPKDKRRKQPKIDLETYLDYKREGWKDKDIARDQRISEQTLAGYKRKWGINTRPGGDKSKYLEMILEKLEETKCKTTSN